MTPATLTALRTLLFLTRSEAAQYVAASPDRQDGVSYRAWRQWEGGERPIPSDVAEHITQLADLRTEWLDNAARAVEILTEDDPHTDIALCWYTSPDDLPFTSCRARA